jgi:RNA polymerase sigma-70 factor (ECF subfamily)
MEETFESNRPYLFAIAYRMLGSAMDAEDMVQETYIRYQKAQPENLHSLKAYLTTILTRLCIDQLDLAFRKRELYVGPWLPEPILTEEVPEVVNPEKKVEREESISLAFLVLLEKLQPFERAVFLLREVFEYEFAEIAEMLEKSEAACRRSFSRAKQHLLDSRPRFAPAPEAHRQLLNSFLTAVQGGEMTPLTELLSEDVTVWVDGGGKVKQAALQPISGREAVTRFIQGSKRFWQGITHADLEEVNGQTALVIRRDNGQVFSVLTMDFEQGQIATIRIMANPEKLSRI